jgi:hypothetical protein
VAVDKPIVENGFIGMWTIDIEGGGVAWLEVHEKQGFLDADLLWKGGSVVPVSHVYLVDENNLVVTRTREVLKKKDENGNKRKHVITHTMKVKKVGNEISGKMIMPKWSEMGEKVVRFTGKRLPAVPAAPNLAAVKYGKAIQLFNGKSLDGWRMVDSKDKNGFKVENGELVNDPVQQKGKKRMHYGNLRTDQEFGDFNLKLEVNVPAGNNSGIYLKGMYEVQVYDSYGKELDSHHMGALYSRITPTMSAEKPGGSWQSFDITLCQRHVTVILNGKKIIDNQPVHGPTGGAIISDVFAKGPIYLQGDHGNVKYRNIVLKPIL